MRTWSVRLEQAMGGVGLAQLMAGLKVFTYTCCLHWACL